MKIIILLLITFFNLNIALANANEIINRYLYDVGEEVSYKVEPKNNPSYVIRLRLAEVTDDQEVWEVFNDPSVDKMVLHRITGNWIKSFKNGNITEEAKPYATGLKFPLKAGDKWINRYTYIVRKLQLRGTSKSWLEAKNDTIKINNKTYETLKIEMKNPLWDNQTDTAWLKQILWIDIETGKTVREAHINTFLKINYTSTLVE